MSGCSLGHITEQVDWFWAISHRVIARGLQAASLHTPATLQSSTSALIVVNVMSPRSAQGEALLPWLLSSDEFSSQLTQELIPHFIRLVFDIVNEEIALLSYLLISAITQF